MDKIQMAQRFAEMMLAEHFKGNGKYNDYGYVDGIAQDAWLLADAMQAEAEKRKQQKLDEVRKGLKGGWFTEREGEHFEDALYENLANTAKEWQPDWSQAPKTAIAWQMRYGSSTEARWVHNLEITGFDYSVAPTFGYVGSWQDSLRKRPSGGRNESE